MNEEIKKLYSNYSNGKIERRKFIRKLMKITGGLITVAPFYPMFASHPIKRAMMNDTNEDLFIDDKHTYPGESGEIKAFLARPKKMKKYPAVIVIHQNVGLQQHERDVTMRLAKEGFLTLAPDALSPLGGTSDGDWEKSNEMLRKLNNDEVTKDFVAAVKYLKTHPLSNGKVGCTGFCWGGAITNQIAVNSPDLDAAVPYYGMQPKIEDVHKIKAPIMAHYGGEDARINQGIPAFEEALKKTGIEYHIYIYEGAKHAFNFDPDPDRYHEEAAKLAWKRTVNFFKEKLKA